MKITAAAVASLALSLFATSALASPSPLNDGQMDQVVAGLDFTIVNEVSDQPGVSATTHDPLLVNAWGLSQAPADGPLWVSNNGTGTSTLYNSETFAKIPLNVTIPGVGGEQGNPTGTVFTSLKGNQFAVTENGVTGHSLFLFDSEDGTISGWAPTVDFTNAVTAVNQPGSIFKGLAVTHFGDELVGSFFGGSFDFKFPDLTNLRQFGQASMIYAADFANHQVKVFDGNFTQVNAFTDPSLPGGYSPFNVQALNGKIYVAFAVNNGDPDEVHGAGLGVVDVFDTGGHKLQTLVAPGGPLNAPWGLAIAPLSFGKFAGALLVGNFGDGKVNAFNAKTGAFLGTLNAPGGAPLSIPGLWALASGPDGTMIFSSGPADESHGLVGVIRPNFAPASWAFQSHVAMGH